MSKKDFMFAVKNAESECNAFAQAVEDYNQVVVDRQNEDESDRPSEKDLKDAFESVKAAKESAENAMAELESEAQNLLDEMTEVFESRSERWQESDKGSEYQDRMSMVEEVASCATQDVADWDMPEEGEEADVPEFNYLDMAKDVFE